jgi:ribosomal protein S12 methylthiotransferase
LDARHQPLAAAASAHPIPPVRHAALISLGCSKNLADSEDLVTALRTVDFQLTKELPQADLVLVNTCGFIEGAKRESIEHILKAAAERRAGAKLYVAGCLTERYLDDLKRDLPEVDRFVTFADYDRFAAVVRRDFPDAPQHRLRNDQRSQLTPPHFAFLKIAEGCDNTCNFCAIPLFRGKHRSVPEAEILKRARLLAERGVQEINVISQHLDYYGQDLYGERRLPQLVRALGKAAPEAWIRLHYCYPNDFTDALIAAMAETPNCARYVDMPIQHASSRMLAVMGRRTTREQIEERLAAIRAGIPGVAIRTTFIVGHPGERAADQRELLGFLQEQDFAHVGFFPYSDEDGTTAAKMPKKVPARTIAARLKAAQAVQRPLHRARQKRWIGREVEVLIDTQRDFGVYAARHQGQAHEVDSVTWVEAESLPIGRRARVRITGVRGDDLVAVAV